MVTRCGQPTIVVYDREKCIEILMSQIAATPYRGGAELELSIHETAEEHFSVNTEGSWVGPRTPAYLVRPDEVG